MSTWLGGNCCVPNACRNKPKTTRIRTKHVVISRIDGARLTTVNSSITCSDELRPSGLVHCSGPPPSPAGSSIFAPAFGCSWPMVGRTKLRPTTKTASQPRLRRAFFGLNIVALRGDGRTPKRFAHRPAI